MSLKRPFVPKSDGKQWFTTTTGRPLAGVFSKCLVGGPLAGGLWKRHVGGPLAGGL